MLLDRLLLRRLLLRHCGRACKFSLTWRWVRLLEPCLRSILLRICKWTVLVSVWLLRILRILRILLRLLRIRLLKLGLRILWILRVLRLLRILSGHTAGHLVIAAIGAWSPAVDHYFVSVLDRTHDHYNKHHYIGN